MPRRKKQPDEFLNGVPTEMELAHFRSSHELYYLEIGQATHFIGNELFFLKSGDMLFVPKGTLHTSNPKNVHGTETLLFSFDDDFEDKDFSAHVEELKKIKHIQFQKEHTDKIKELTLKINNATENAKKLYLKEMLALISECKDPAPVNRLHDNHGIVQEAAKYISENCDRDLRMEVVAGKFAMTRNLFSKMFKESTGISPKEYVIISRISTAEKLLTTTNLQIPEIAAQCGFNDSRYFETVFIKLKGISPQGYATLYR